MDDRTDANRLSAWRERHDREAMDALVRRNIHFVYATALRMLRDATWAQDVTQAVFLLLIQKSPRLGSDAALVVWLHRATRYAASNARRVQMRRDAHHRRAARLETIPMHEMNEAIDLADERAKMIPLLDEALESLRPRDRSGVLLCYFQRRSFRDIASALGTTEAAARKRVERAVDRLRAFFASRGVETTSASSLVACFGAEAAHLAPAPLVQTTSKFAEISHLSATPTSTEILTGVLNTMLITKVKIAASIALIVTLGWATAVVALDRSQTKAETRGSSPAGGNAASAGEPRTFPIDPVAYVTTSQEVTGKDEHSLVRGLYRYTFADANNKKTFEAQPELYEVQLGGACARMGPLTDGVMVDLYALHDGKIFVFASEHCRQFFLANADGMLESDDPLPDVDDGSAKRGRELLDQMIRSMGGAETIDAIATYEDKMLRVAGQDDAFDSLSIAFADPARPSVRELQQRPQSAWSMTLAGGRAWFQSNEGIQPMAPQQQRALERQIYRNPLVIVRSRSLPDFVCSRTGQTELNGAAVEQVAVAFNGATTTLLIDPGTGELRGLQYRGRGPGALLGQLEVVFSDFKTIDGVTLPHTRAVSFNGEYAAQGAAQDSGTLDEVHINRAIDKKVFEMSESR